MKKTLIIALAGIMLFAFTQCGGGGDKDTKDAKETKEVKVAKGTKEFQSLQEFYNNCEKNFKSASTCEELSDAVSLLVLQISEAEFAEEEKMTAEEKTKMQEIVDDISKLGEKRNEELSCEFENLVYFLQLD